MKRLRDILEKVAKGEIAIDEAERLLRVLAIEEIGNLAKIDIGREHRRGIPEVILAEGKTPEDLAEITVKMLRKSGRAIISRVTKEQIRTIKDLLSKDADAQVHSRARIIIVRTRSLKVEKTGGKIGILTGGTSDIQVAEEARIIAEEMGCEVITAYDVGVAGIHRLIPPLKEMVAEDVDILIVVAGREGALPTVVAGMVDLPVIAVPTSVGYGLGEKGVSALIAMLQSCSLGLAVVNIDGGVAAGAIAAMIANRIAKFKKKD
ncbi:TPA: nickel pincer cofactor biosynthesis protein LarB [Candidatus Bathyarchaeota archaeon]|nr:nickel pincer cofactor biosynthesis protein LarB [Candidatus Bathyarchaeota archaeon]